MSQPVSLAAILLEAAAYAIIGSVVVMTVILLPDYIADLRTPPAAGPTWIENDPGLSYPAPGGMLPGLFIAVAVGRIVIGRIKANRLVYWAGVQGLAAILSIPIQLAAVTSLYHWPIIFQDGYWQEPVVAVGKLFILLTPFTIAFAIVTGRIANRGVKNSLK